MYPPVKTTRSFSKSRTNGSNSLKASMRLTVIRQNQPVTTVDPVAPGQESPFQQPTPYRAARDEIEKLQESEKDKTKGRALHYRTRSEIAIDCSEF